ncbi:hypothetical protein F5Y15DRAFT_429316 [Xylariaceae sp. FL0016]|nr:hypothetical protein F5Y15DRAFT_429316 [Xylariaceae sp. FL0016]
MDSSETQDAGGKQATGGAQGMGASQTSTGTQPAHVPHQIEDIPYTLWEKTRQLVGLDPYKVWGAAGKAVRAADRSGRYRESNFADMWDDMPETIQTRPWWWTRLWSPETAPHLTPRHRRADRHMHQPLFPDVDQNHRNMNRNTGRHRNRNRPPGPTGRQTMDTPQPQFTEPTTGPKGRRIRTDQPIVGLAAISQKLPPPPEGKWCPTRIDFDAWHGQTRHASDYDNEYYDRAWESLFARTRALAEKWFGAHDLTQELGLRGARDSLWGRSPLTVQFVQYARLVAREDRPYTLWKDVLHDPRHRTWLVVGILAQIMEKKIFTDLLFGADEGMEHRLAEEDQKAVGTEGFRRKATRYNLIQDYMANHGLLPPEFWNCVDDLTGRAFAIFRPLLVILQSLKREVRHPDHEFYQELHDLFAFAGHAQVMMAVSPSVFHILSATPGARFDWAEETQPDMAMYRASKHRHEADDRAWEGLARDSVEGHTVDQDSDAAKRLLHEPLPTDDRERNRQRAHRTRGGKVMIAVFPKLTRYDPRFAATQAFAGERAQTEGQHVSVLARCRVVYYQGLIHAAPTGLTDGVSLDAHLCDIRARRAAPVRWAVAYVPKVTLIPRWERRWGPDGAYAWRWYLDTNYGATTLLWALVACLVYLYEYDRAKLDVFPTWPPVARAQDLRGNGSGPYPVVARDGDGDDYGVGVTWGKVLLPWMLRYVMSAAFTHFFDRVLLQGYWYRPNLHRSIQDPRRWSWHIYLYLVCLSYVCGAQKFVVWPCVLRPVIDFVWSFALWREWVWFYVCNGPVWLWDNTFEDVLYRVIPPPRG